jgi:hypothetical protein
MRQSRWVAIGAVSGAPPDIHLYRPQPDYVSISLLRVRSDPSPWPSPGVFWAPGGEEEGAGADVAAAPAQGTWQHVLGG